MRGVSGLCVCFFKHEPAYEMRISDWSSDGCSSDLGRAVESLKGRYNIAEDVGTSVEDMAESRKSTAHVVGLATEHGGGGDPSPLTAHGCFVGIRAAVDYVGRPEALGGLRVAVDRQSVV